MPKSSDPSTLILPNGTQAATCSWPLAIVMAQLVVAAWRESKGLDS